MTSSEIQDLRQLITEQFSAVHAHLARTDERVASLDAHLIRTDERVASLDAHLIRTDERVASLDAHLIRTDERVASLDAHLIRTDERVDGLGVRLALFAREVRSEIETLRQRVDAGFDRLTSQMDGLAGSYERLRQEYLMMSEQLGRIELNLRDQGLRHAATERRLDVLAGEVAALRARVDAIEQRRPQG
jgi:chromosome segregation ATPase